ncbi:hypothetical protein K474DRAFT_1585545 [Panus rudis PR-1116 ss-1]|nr:hypothetical protein K474DRAFT_1585545 [Panus rudis PR-1116 ss-1]
MSITKLEDHLLFDFPGSKGPRTARKLHLRKLYDLLELCILRNDQARARRVWAILVRCKEINWRIMWKMGVVLLGRSLDDEGEETQSYRTQYLSAMMQQNPDDREAILQELVLRLIQSGQHRKALDELELYLPSPPYEDNPALHCYAGLLSLYLAQPQDTNLLSWNEGLIRNGHAFFEKAQNLDSECPFSEAWLEKVSGVIGNRTKG